jgi:hypothetical protein
MAKKKEEAVEGGTVVEAVAGTVEPIKAEVISITTKPDHEEILIWVNSGTYKVGQIITIV